MVVLLQYIQIKAMVSMHPYLLKLSFIFHLIITHATITEQIETLDLLELLPTLNKGVYHKY